MKNMKKLMALLLAVVLCVSVLGACGGSGEVAYQVAIKDAMGKPITSGVVVKFMQNGAQAGMQVVNENGVAEKTLPAGDYTVELQFTDSEANYKYDASALKLTAKEKAIEVVLNYGLGDKKQTLTVGGKECEAYYINVGATEITLDKENRSYYLFAPTESGTYEFSLGGSSVAIGYYGAPHFVQEASAAEVKDNKFTISVRPEMIGTNNTGTTVLVLGVDAGEGNAVFGIERIGEHAWSVSDEPWIVYSAKTAPTSYTLPAGAAIAEFDLTKPTDSYKLVLDSNGYFHLDSAEGPLVLVRLGKNAKVKYLDPYETILEHTGVNCYFYDADGNFQRKENYTECVAKYIECVDEESGMYPLTEDLQYIIQNNGAHNGWWKLDGNYIFRNDNGENVPGINSEIAWLFMCCYIQG
ncbi:MAG: hypothetical protein IKU07_04390 [Oscillospiraceae bacterium]|nr:hypothetical protein [Oscillospiraceae bacterium]